jgi:hypothetical protein
MAGSREQVPFQASIAASCRRTLPAGLVSVTFGKYFAGTGRPSRAVFNIR